MSKESLEHLSSLMDGELSRDAGSFLTRRLFSDDETCEKWERYHLIRDCIRQPGSKQVVTGLSIRMSPSLDAEEVPTVSTWRNNRWLKPVSGLAIAASVAMMAIVVTAPQPGQTPGEVDATALVPASQPFVSPNTLAGSPVSQAASFAPSETGSSNRLNAYLLRHNQMARTAGRQGFVSFVPIVASPVTAVEDKTESVESKPELETAED
ncbi:MAG: sigma-E factor negative regulatory protein [Lysobacterales bacterium]